MRMNSNQLKVDLRPEGRHRFTPKRKGAAREKLYNLGLGNEFVNDAKSTRNKCTDKKVRLRSTAFCTITKYSTRATYRVREKDFVGFFVCLREKYLQTMYPKRGSYPTCATQCRYF